MNPKRFDTLTMTLSTTATRRGVVRLLAALPITGGLITRLVGSSPEALASHGCRHAGKACARPGQCCTGTCLRNGTCSCNGRNRCPRPTNPCKKAGCKSSGRCVIKNEAAGVACSDDGNPCTKDVCDGSGQCTHPPGASGTVCREASCTDGLVTLEATCDGTETCPEKVSRSCAPYRCHPTFSGCIGSCGGEPDCIDSHYCRVGQCVPKVGTGEPCSRSAECVSGHCFNNLCVAE